MFQTYFFITFWLFFLVQVSELHSVLEGQQKEVLTLQDSVNMANQIKDNLEKELVDLVGHQSVFTFTLVL